MKPSRARVLATLMAAIAALFLALTESVPAETSNVASIRHHETASATNPDFGGGGGTDPAVSTSER